mmetsp:Transcript_10632/g.25208  ORF Transcript_10632/g.25208 Transcript_10632/m.25208 type:complete len:87 (-) Transcript_10632:1461-1721(-)
MSLQRELPPHRSIQGQMRGGGFTSFVLLFQWCKFQARERGRSRPKLWSGNPMPGGAARGQCAEQAAVPSFETGGAAGATSPLPHIM